MPLYGKVSIGSWGDDNSNSNIDLSDYITKEEFELLKTEVKEEFIDVNSQLENKANKDHTHENLNCDTVDSLHLICLTQSEYDALETKDNTTLYFIKSEV